MALTFPKTAGDRVTNSETGDESRQSDCRSQGWEWTPPCDPLACPILFAGSGVLAVLLVAVLLEPVREVARGGLSPAAPLCTTLLATFRLFRDKRLCLLVLLPLYSGFQQAFLAGDFTKVQQAANLISGFLYCMELGKAGASMFPQEGDSRHRAQISTGPATASWCMTPSPVTCPSGGHALPRPHRCPLWGY